MAPPTVPFHYGLFYHAMIGLLGREPDTNYSFGFDGRYTFRYKPKDAAERKRLAERAPTLRDWLRNFELIALDSRCEYGRLPHPGKDEEGEDYLEIHIVHSVEKKQ